MGGIDGFLVKVRAENLDGGPPPATEAAKTPVIFVPGIAGTRLEYAETFDASDPLSNGEKWPRTEHYLGDVTGDLGLLDLRLASDGIRPFDNP